MDVSSIFSYQPIKCLKSTQYLNVNLTFLLFTKISQFLFINTPKIHPKLTGSGEMQPRQFCAIQRGSPSSSSLNFTWRAAAATGFAADEETRLVDVAISSWRSAPWLAPRRHQGRARLERPPASTSSSSPLPSLSPPPQNRQRFPLCAVTHYTPNSEK